MNTYFNEITSKPVNRSDTDTLYKIPAGAMCGNGDLGVVFDNDGTEHLAQAGRTLCHGLRNVQIIVMLGNSSHIFLRSAAKFAAICNY